MRLIDYGFIGVDGVSVALPYTSLPSTRKILGAGIVRDRLNIKAGSEPIAATIGGVTAPLTCAR